MSFNTPQPCYRHGNGAPCHLPTCSPSYRKRVTMHRGSRAGDSLLLPSTWYAQASMHERELLSRERYPRHRTLPETYPTRAGPKLLPVVGATVHRDGDPGSLFLPCFLLVSIKRGVVKSVFGPVYLVTESSLSRVFRLQLPSTRLIREPENRTKVAAQTLSVMDVHFGFHHANTEVYSHALFPSFGRI